MVIVRFRLQPDAIDLEYPAATKQPMREVMQKAKSAGVPVLNCYENFKETPSEEDLLNILQAEERFGADIAKFAVKANSFEDTLTVLSVAEKAKEVLNIPYVTIAMGPSGSISRYYSLLLGASLTYCAVAAGKEGAPGQLPVKKTKELYQQAKDRLGKFVWEDIRAAADAL